MTAIILTLAAALAVGAPGSAPEGVEAFLGSWNTRITDGEGTFLGGQIDVEKHGESFYVGLVWRWASYAPVKRIEVEDGVLKAFDGPDEEERMFEMRLVDGGLKGKVTYADGEVHHFEGRRAPELKTSGEPQWGEPITLFDGKSLDGWSLRDPEAKMGWDVVDGELAVVEPEGNADLVSDGKFQDMKLHLEFKVAPHSNSGVYVRGRYEVQIYDQPLLAFDTHGMGAVYSRLAPCTSAAKLAGEWQSYDITIVGRSITIVLNGTEIISGHLRGITGGAINPFEDEPGPLMLQGDHGKVRFRNIVVIPAK